MPRVFKPSLDSDYARALCADLNNVAKFQVIPRTCSAPLFFPCREACAGGDTTLLSKYVSDHGKDEVTLDDIDRLLALICCSKHVPHYKAILRGLLVSTDLDKPDYSADKSVHQVCFGSEDYENTDHTFSFSVPDQASDSAPIDPSDVSDTRRLLVSRGGRKEVREGNTEADSQNPPLAGSSSASLDKVESDTPTPGTPRLKSRNASDPTTPPTRSSLSPDVRRTPNPNRSEFRTRTPSPSHARQSSDYGRLAEATMLGDKSYERPPACNQDKVLQLIGKPLFLSDLNKRGSVYVVRDPELDLVKIGFTTKSISARVRGIASQCPAASHEWQIENEAANVPILAYRRLEELVHRDLAPHRWFFLCECGASRGTASGYTEHQEWFGVSSKIAIKTIELWKDFLQLDPYGPPLRGTEMRLKEPWIHRVDKCRRMDLNEKHEDHEARLDRWRKFLHLQEPCEPTRVSKLEETEASITKIKSEPVEEDAREPTRVPKQDETEALKTTIKSEPVGEDAATTFMNVPQKTPEDSPIPSIEPATVAVPPTSAPSVFVDPGDSDQTPKFHGHAAPSPTTPSRGEAAPSALASAEDQPKAGMQFEDSKRHRISTHNLDATSKVVHDREKLHVNLLAALNHKRPAIPERTIIEDLTALRWPLGCAVAFALHTPYVPPLLSAMLWTIFLPSLVAELRGWTL
ncbi:hypothetical protein KC323_g5156 [Hortaea werneckii]|nr:hypothetical protein KC323_g5156 [Hortaea werneckii]